MKSERQTPTQWTLTQWLLIISLLCWTPSLTADIFQDRFEANPLGVSLVRGLAFKGPFRSGSEVTLQTLNTSLQPTADPISSTIDSNSGAFALPVTRNTLEAAAVLKLEATGRFFHEVLGSDVRSEFNLSALTDRRRDLNLNLLTTIEQPLVQRLVADGVAFEVAKAQAVVQSFALMGATTQTTDAAAIDLLSDDAAVLLALTATVLTQPDGQPRLDPELSTLLDGLAQGLRNGAFGDALLTELLSSANAVNDPLIRSNLVAYFQSQNLDQTVPDFSGALLAFKQSLGYAVTVTAANNSRLTAPQTRWVRSGQSASFVAQPEAGYDRIAPTGDCPAGGFNDTTSTWVTGPINADCELVFDYPAGERTITFVDPLDDSTHAVITASYQTPITPPAEPSRIGREFIRWQPSVPSTMPADDTELVAVWRNNRYSLEFDSAGGEPVAAITAPFDSPVVAPADPSRLGHDFLGWQPSVPNRMPPNNQTHVAQWHANTASIDFDLQGGEIEFDGGPQSSLNLTATFDELMPALPSVPTLSGHQFEGFWTGEFDEAASEFIYFDRYYSADGQPARFWREQAFSMNLFARWQILQIEVVFDLNGGVSNESSDDIFRTGTVNDHMAPPAPTKPGFEFTGWQPHPPEDCSPQFCRFPPEDTRFEAQWQPAVFDVRLDGQGADAGWSDPTYQVTFESPMPGGLTAPTKGSEQFGGFWTASDGGGDQYYDAAMQGVRAWDIPENKTLFAYWFTNQVTLTFNTAGGTPINPIVANAGTGINAPPDPTRVGWTFTGWDPVVPSTMPSENRTHIAQWTIEEYTLSFDSDGGSAVEAITAEFNTAVTAPEAPTKAGHTFIGWQPPIPAQIPANDQTHTAQWRANTVRLDFDSAGGSPVDPIIDTFGEAITAPVSTRTGYTFDGWDPGVPATMPANDQTFTAQWIANQYQVTLLTTPDGTGGSATVTTTYDLPMPTATKPTLEGLEFAGYWTEPGGGGQRFYGDDMSSARNWDRLTDLTLYANWRPLSVTLNFDSAGGSAVAPISALFDSEIDPPEAPTRLGHTFIGWQPEVPGTMPASSQLHVAQWSKERYTLSFDSAGGSAVDAMDYDFESVVNAPSTPARTGHTFAGWSPALPQRMPASNQTHVAQWTPNQYRVTLNPQGGSGGTPSVEATFGQALPSAQAPSRANARFAGYWAAPGGSGTQFYTTNMSSVQAWNLDNDTTLHAHWIEDERFVVSVDGQPTQGGTISGDVSSGEQQTFFAGSEITLSASATAPYGFIHWRDADTNQIVSTDATVTLEVQADTSLTAVFNQAPSAPVVQVTPTGPSVNFDLHCNVVGESVDPDGDAITYHYQWFLNGAPTQHRQPTLPASVTEEDDLWRCVVVASDGLSDSAPSQCANGQESNCSKTIKPSYCLDPNGVDTPCRNDTPCIENAMLETFMCDCSDTFFTGDRCQHFDACAEYIAAGENPCKNYGTGTVLGTCQSDGGGVRCVCVEGQACACCNGLDVVGFPCTVQGLADTGEYCKDPDQVESRFNLP